MAEHLNQPQGNGSGDDLSLLFDKLKNFIRWLFEPIPDNPRPKPDQRAELAQANSLLEQQQQAVAQLDSDIRSLLGDLFSCHDAIAQLRQQYADLRHEVDHLK